MFTFAAEKLFTKLENKYLARMASYILADNQDLTRLAVETLLRQGEGNRVYRAVDKEGLVALLKEHEHAVVVLDYRLFDFNDDDQLLIVSERFALTQWLLLSDDLTPALLRRMLYASHQFSVVFKDCPLSELREALRTVAGGERYLSSRVVDVVIGQQQREDEAVEEPQLLTQTEQEILRGIAQGKTTKEIAAERYSSIHTVTTHRKNIFRKLNVNTAHEAIKYALRAGLVDPSVFYI